MRIAAAAVLTAVLGCRDQGPAVEALYARAELDNQQGRPAAAYQAVQELLGSRARLPEIEWRARVLGAEILLDRDEHQAGMDLVKAPLPGPLQGGLLEARYHKVRATLAWRQGDNVEMARQLARAAGLAPPDGAQPLALEILWWTGVSRNTAGAAEEAAQLFQQVVDLASSQPRWRANALNSLGFTDLRADRCPAALPRFERALADARGIPAVVARVQLNLGICLTNLGDFERAEQVLSEAVATFESLGARRYVQNGLGSLANNHMVAGERGKAIAVYERALALARLHDPAGAARWAVNLAGAYGDQENWRLASRYTEDTRRLLAAAAGDRRTHLRLLWNEARIAESQQDLGRAERAYLDVIAGSAGNLELLWVAQARLANVYQKLGRQAEAGTLFSQAFGSVEHLRQQSRELEHEIGFLERLVCLHRDHVRWLIGQGKHAEALLAYESSRVQILAGRLGRARPGSPPPGQDLRQKARGRGEVLISYMLTPRGSFAWVVDGQDVRVVELPPEAEVEKAAGAYRAFIDGSLRDPRQIENSPAHALYKLVVAPLLPALSAGARVTVAPDGALHGVPLGALVVPASEGQPARYWIENVTLTVTPSLLTLPERAPEGGVGPAGAGLVGIGDPPDAGVEFPRLPSAGDELAALERHFPGHNRLMGRGVEARPEFYRQPQLGTAALIHFATHALANPMRPLDSTIVLAPGSGGSRLSVRDVLNVPLEAQLVTISACRSAGARHYHGEGLVGLAWGFLTAGARHVVAGLWDVPDRSTGELMDRMYAELARGARPAEALRAAQLALAHKPGAWGTPFYWAAFQVYAGGGPADGKPGHLAAKKATAQL